jgi:hypothetical protein
LYLQHLVFVTPLLLSAAIVEELAVWRCIFLDILTMHLPINVKSPNNISKWHMGFNSAFKGLITLHLFHLKHLSQFHTTPSILHDKLQTFFSYRIWRWLTGNHLFAVSRRMWHPLNGNGGVTVFWWQWTDWNSLRPSRHPKWVSAIFKSVNIFPIRRGPALYITVVPQ